MNLVFNSKGNLFTLKPSRRQQDNMTTLRYVLSFAITVALATVLECNAQNLPLPPLPYAYDALEPVIDEQTMRVHHLKHHQGYTNKLNDALAVLREDPETKHLAKLGVDALLHQLDQVPGNLRGKIRNNGGGYVNHDKFWKIMKPNAAPPAQDSVMIQYISSSFGDFDTMKDTFIKSSLAVFGSGWSWLVYDAEADKLVIQTTPNQDVPDDPVVVGCDVWEHAYYLKYKNKREEYVTAWFGLINWEEAERRLVAAVELANKNKEL